MALLNDDLDPLVEAGLLKPSSQQDAALQALFAIGNQIANRSAPRLSPTPPPMDLSAAQTAYQNSLTNALQTGALRQKLKQRDALKKMVAPLTPSASDVKSATDAYMQPLESQNVLQNLVGDEYQSDAFLPSKTDLDPVRKMVEGTVTKSLSTPKLLRGMPEGQRSLVQSLADAGYGEQAISAALKFASKTDDYDVVKIGKNSYGKINKNTGTLTPITQDENNDLSWDGTSITAQAFNILNRMAPLVRNGTANAQQMRAYEQSAAVLMRPKVFREKDEYGNERLISQPGIPLHTMDYPVTPTMANMATRDLGTSMPKAPGENVAKAYAFGQTMGSAGKILNDLEFGDENFRMPFYAEAFGEEGALARFLTRKTLNPSQQQYLQAANQWITALLRKESGAVISIPESRNYFSIYFPLPGDGPGTVRQKRKAREFATKVMQEQGAANALYLEQIRKRTGGTTGAKKVVPIKPDVSIEQIKKMYGLGD